MTRKKSHSDTPAIATRPPVTREVGLALDRMRDALTRRRNWQENYAVLLSESVPAKDKDLPVKLALKFFLEDRLRTLTPAEIEVATAKAVTSSPFAPDVAVLLQLCYDSVIERRYGDPQRLFTDLIQRVGAWMTGGAIDWKPVEAFLISAFGARHLTETPFDSLRKQWREALVRFIVEGEPNFATDPAFAKPATNTIAFYANARRKRRDFVALKPRAGRR